MGGLLGLQSDLLGLQSDLLGLQSEMLPAVRGGVVSFCFSGMVRCELGISAVEN